MRTVPLLVLCVACAADPYGSGRDEPIRVSNGTFHPGELPVGDETTGPTVLTAAGVATVVTQGQAVTKYSGLATPDAYSVAVALPDAGTGYWVVPVTGPDVVQDNDMTWSMNLEITPDVPFGLQTLAFVAIGKDGTGGPRYDAELCILPESANGGLSACDPSVMPQSDVLSLTWDTLVDLDLVVVTPDGKVVSPKDPTTASPTGTGTEIPSDLVSDPSTGTITRDSNRDCTIDGINRESLVFPGEPAHGEYRVYASLSRACSASYVNFQLTLFHRGDAADDGSFPIEEYPLGGGELLADQADAGASLGTFVVAVNL